MYNNKINLPLFEKMKRNIMQLLFFFIFVVILVNGIIRIISENHKNQLNKAIEYELLGTTGTYGIAIKNLKTGQTYYKNEHMQFDVGSLYKLWVMAVAFQHLQAGLLSNEEILGGEVTTLNKTFNIASESAEITKGTITLSVENALLQMITISHNYAALLLAERVKLSKIEKFLSDYNFNESSLGPPKATPFDIALFFEKLYKDKLANQENTQKMIDLLKKQTLNNKLPKYLPKNVSIAHKTGEIDYFTHDGGIVFTDKGDYIIVVMSKSQYPSSAEERIGQISKAAYSYFVQIQTPFP